MNITVFLLLRLAVATSMLGHGLVRIPKIKVFSQWMIGAFEKSMLPKALILPFSYGLPVAELIIGLLLLTGLGTRMVSVAGATVMLMLIFGSAMIENWEAIPSQMIHLLFFAAIIQFIQYNGWALDNLLTRN
ncbi:thiosulfate dehydrogenase [quinone] large subunit [Chitinophaga terrae (ex Kim and Jung 2007)]|uniref:DoxX family membrane protein n=1 Tax=Chitinophaga terrae (ex Kim and Jung 2007) TaxID=408074 RepID=UPI00277E08B8|nr:DoxX family membrane protein [Chitinophaga terrae (ex Kim and Jung 2007)]MDQ0110420.1 thiosulfate dehydrogenase [quinone] large subunit [Chitinophaga terrae (ex Kim and Jung 2007)]